MRKRDRCQRPLPSVLPANLERPEAGAGAETGWLNPAIPLSPIWRSGCQGVGVDGHWLVVVVVAGCGRGLRGGPGVRGFATVVMLIFGGCPKTFVRRTSTV